MGLSVEPIIYGLVFVSVIVLVNGLYLTVFGKSISMNGRVNRRLALLEKGESREKVLEQLRKEMTQHMRSQSIPLYALLASKAQKANIAFSPVQLVMVMAGLTVLAFLALTLGTGARRRCAPPSPSPWAWAASMSGSTGRPASASA
ncbi:hypothetical protein ruthe_00433 [Rubellimicrobium thermophilum DSM 16684]|uniref:Type II secretion system protein TadB-like N-terminal domain-containing protein n=1 Tax=Rubellimicrobium thermophilum DSM 16684 TaxID=1123069 RepID=S9SME8_9RHOB|nr:hypothetical protein ruthe_00433 [Rubellimicrobium thermophilum DSM 16684]